MCQEKPFTVFITDITFMQQIGYYLGWWLVIGFFLTLTIGYIIGRRK